ATVITELTACFGRAYKKGFSESTGDIVVVLDADHSYPLDALSYLVEAFLQSRVQFLSASRFPRARGRPLKNLVGNFIVSAAMSILVVRWVQDSQSGLWVFKRSALEKMVLRSDGIAFSQEIKIEAIRNRSIGFREIYISYSQRVGEKELKPWRDGLTNLLFLF